MLFSFFTPARWFITLIFLLSTLISTNVYADDYEFDKFLKNELSAGFYENSFMNVHIKHPPSPIYWTASTKADNGFMLMYQRNIYHTEKHFSINVGGSTSAWKRQNQTIGAFSAFVAFQFWLFDTHYVHPYIMYSIAGPTLLTRHRYGPANLGESFIFQDVLGIGAQIGHSTRALNLELKLVHYSNGDIFPRNSGFDIPIVFALGYSFS